MFHRGRETHICENPGPDLIKLDYGLSLISEKKSNRPETYNIAAT